MSSITFTVVDQNCESADQSFTPPSISMVTASTTTIATNLGWVEFGAQSSPPKKYKTISYAGSTEQQLWYQGVQIGGARYDLGGSDSIDSFGNKTSTHTKVLSVQCDNGSVVNADPQATVGTMLTNNEYNNLYNFATSFLGYFGATTQTHPEVLSAYPSVFLGTKTICPVSNLPYLSVGNKASFAPFNQPAADLPILWNAALGATSSTVTQATNSGTDNPVILPYLPLMKSVTGGGTSLISFLGLNPYQVLFSEFFEPPAGNIVPVDFIFQDGTLGVPIPDFTPQAEVIFTHNYSATLSNEYTDAEALANAVVISGNSAIAVNNPRTTGFVSTVTSVVYTLSCSNLVDGKSYTVSVELANLTTGVATTVTQNITATGATASIIGTIPTPPAGQQVQVRRPRIALIS